MDLSGTKSSGNVSIPAAALRILVLWMATFRRMPIGRYGKWTETLGAKFLRKPEKSLLLLPPGRMTQSQNFDFFQFFDDFLVFFGINISTYFGNKY